MLLMGRFRSFLFDFFKKCSADMVNYPYWSTFKTKMRQNHQNVYLRWSTVLVALILGIVLLLNVLNYFYWHVDASTLTEDLLLILCFSPLVIFIAVVLPKKFSRVSMLIFSLIVIYVLTLMQFLLIDAVSFTPFPLIDHILIASDAALHFNVIAAMQWTYQHPLLLKLLRFSYGIWGVQLFLLPLWLGFFKQKRLLNFFLLFFLVLVLVTFMTYFFFPTLGPGSSMYSKLFPLSERSVGYEFHKWHHTLLPGETAKAFSAYLGVRSLPSSVGIISFPSFHIIGSSFFLMVASVSINTLRRSQYKIFNYLLIVLWCYLLFINISLAFSTVLLGHHYLTDILGSYVIMSVLLWVTMRTFPGWLCAEDIPQHRPLNLIKDILG